MTKKKAAPKKAKSKKVSKAKISLGFANLNANLQAGAKKASDAKAIADKKADAVAKKAADDEQKKVNAKRKERDAKKK